MGAHLRAAAFVAAGVFAVGAAEADEAAPAPSRPDATIFETSARVRLAWTEIPFRPDRPKGWDEIAAPEARVSLRILSGLFEGKAEAIVASDHFAHFQEVNSNQLRGEVQLGLNTGDWSYLLEWKSRNVFDPGYDDFIVGQNAYALRVRHRFTAPVVEGMPVGMFQASVAGGYVAATPPLLRRNFAEFEIEWVQRFGGGFVFIMAPKLELADYDVFPGDRKDAVVSLRLIPAYNFGDGVTLSLEGQATVAFSTLDIKTGETWELTPNLRFQKTL